MPDFDIAKLKKSAPKEHGISQSHLKKTGKQYYGGRKDRIPAGETPFRPPIQTHLEVLTKIASSEERARVMSNLQQLYGNRYVQSLIEAITATTSTDTVRTDVQRQEEEEEEMQLTPLPQQIYNEAIKSPPTEEEEEVQASPAVLTAIRPDMNAVANTRQNKHTRPPEIDAENSPAPVLVPVDPSRAGACVIVQGTSFDIWINPAEPICIVEGMIEHEMKHIEDFEADPYYSTIPIFGGIPDGETFYYADRDDARKFENAAIDVEMEWLRTQLEGNPPEEDRAIMENRLNVTLPAYRASFG